MEEYLLGHNVTMSDFWIFIVMWVLGLLFLIFLWKSSIKMANREESYDGGVTYFTTIVISVIITPLLLMGAWHFINMVLTLLFGFDLYIS